MSISNALPSKNTRLLKSLLGKKIKAVKRQLFKGDLDLPDYEQNADGPIEFTFIDNSKVHFVTNTEAFSICIFSGKMPVYGDSYEFMEVSRNSFWTEKVGQKIERISILRSPDWSDFYPCEFGVELSFSNEQKIAIEYRDDEDYPDMMIVTSQSIDECCVLHRFSLYN